MAEVKTLPETLVDEIAVRIDGQQFFVRNPDAVRALDRIYLDRGMVRIGVLASKDENTADEKDEVDRIINRICRIAVDIPDELFSKLTGEQRQKIADFFVERLYRMSQGTKTPQQVPGMRQAKKQTGRKSFRG